ncbi:MAG: DcrB-related protein [Chloroflexi bacterium]|nr:DcrB-related protein [Chloroflexota bacterium]
MTSKTKKIVVWSIAIVAILCVIAVAGGLILTQFIGQAVTESVMSPEEAQEAAKNIATFSLPKGYSADTGMSILGTTVVVFKKPGSSVVISLVEMPLQQELNDSVVAEMESQLSQAGSGYSNMNIVSKKELTVRGQPALLIVQEGNVDGASSRQVMVIFQGNNNNLAMLSIAGPVKGWDAKAYDRMILSIK